MNAPSRIWNAGNNAMSASTHISAMKLKMVKEPLEKEKANSMNANVIGKTMPAGMHATEKKSTDPLAYGLNATPIKSESYKA